jgi:hypothetical protein
MQQKDVEIGRVYRVLESMSRSSELDRHVVICSGTTYAAVANGTGVEILHLASGVKGAWRFIPLPKPTFFIARIKQSRIFAFFKHIDVYACVAFMIFPAALEKDIVGAIINDRNPFRSPVLDLADHFVYFVDTDHPESSTGICEASSVGRDSPFKGGLYFA